VHGSASARPIGSRSLTRRGHRPPAIECHLLEQAAMFVSRMSALQRITARRAESEKCHELTHAPPQTTWTDCIFVAGAGPCLS
jgi:hypothetical protein